MKHYFPEVKKPIPYAGPRSKKSLAFKYYDPARKVAGKTMARHLKFAVAYWHTFKGAGDDPFGRATMDRPWLKGSSDVEIAEKTLEAAFEFFSKLGVSFYCCHDRDLAPEGRSLDESSRNLDRLVKKARRLQRQRGVKLLWGTANLFSHPRYAHGAATNPDPLVFAHAAAQVRRAMDAMKALGASGFVFWGGREGYSTLLNTRMQQEREQLAAFLHMAVDYKKKSGFKGVFFIEPKPKEPTAHQYDFDAAATLNFLREFQLFDHFMLNLEANHATLASHNFEHELMCASAAGKLGSLDVNRGDPTLGWDTDQFPRDLVAATWAMLILLRQGGLRYGGLNFDAKVRRGSVDTVDLFHAHIGGMDTFAQALLIADRIRKDGVMDKLLAARYAGYGRGMGRKILKRRTSLPSLEQWAEKMGEPRPRSGRQEALENMLNDYLYCTRIE